MIPRSPRRHTPADVFAECEHDGEDECDCMEKDEQAYDLECEARLERYLEGDWDD